MPEKNLMLTPAGLQKLQTELDELKNIRRREVAEKIKEAKEQGDLSENAEYAAAKEEQGIIEARIAELEHSIKTADVVEPMMATGSVMLGTKVEIEMNGKMFSYEIVGTNEADPSLGKISNASPLGKSLMGKKEGDEVQYKSPDGTIMKAVLRKVQ